MLKLFIFTENCYDPMQFIVVAASKEEAVEMLKRYDSTYSYNHYYCDEFDLTPGVKKHI